MDAKLSWLCGREGSGGKKEACLNRRLSPGYLHGSRADWPCNSPLNKAGNSKRWTRTLLDNNSLASQRLKSYPFLVDYVEERRPIQSPTVEERRK